MISLQDCTVRDGVFVVLQKKVVSGPNHEAVSSTVSKAQCLRKCQIFIKGALISCDKQSTRCTCTLEWFNMILFAILLKSENKTL